MHAFDIHQLRGQLNELPFENGRRSVLLGRIDEMFENEAPPAVTERLRQIERELGRHDLIMERGKDDPNDLYAVQVLKKSALDGTWLAEGMRWASNITAIALEMVVPGLLGYWVDTLIGTNFLALVGFALGAPLAIWHLIRMTTRVSQQKQERTK
jgi:hypothetical protein